MAHEASGHVALVTGGNKGIGAAIARRLSAAGAAVAVAGRDLEACRALAGELGERAAAVRIDVTDAGSVADGVAAARAELGEVDWLVNNAGIALTGKALGTDELYRRQMEVNFHGARRMVDALAPGMLERGYGRVVNVASSAALVGYSYVAAYCASKHALLGYTRALAHELAKAGVTVSAVCPHYVDSPMLDASAAGVAGKTGRPVEEIKDTFRAQNPSGRLVTMDEVAEAVLSLLLADEAGIVELDGGEPRRLAH